MEMLDESHRQPVIEWLKARGFMEDEARITLGISWSTRAGYDFTSLMFYPLDRHANDAGWDAIVGHHASGTNPRTMIGRCETLADVEMVYNTLRLINGYQKPEDERGPVST